jgi:glycosyltransferase involved in cell wall biosynthesis
MRIVIVGPAYPFRGGIAHYTALLFSSLARRHEVKLVSLSRQYPRILFPGKRQTDRSRVRLEVPGAEPLVDSMNPLSWLRAARRIRAYKPDLVIIQWWHPFFAPAFRAIAGRCRKFARVVFLCHNVVPHETRGSMKSLTKWALSRGDAFIVHSQEDMLNLKAMIPGAQVRRARHPTYEVFAQGPLSELAGRKAQAREELGLKTDENVILFFGLVREYKGLRYLVQAMPAILESVDATLIVAGEFYESFDKYVRLVRELSVENKVHLRNEYVPNENVAAYFLAADVVVLPYISATQSGIAQIAYGLDRPVITTNVGGLPETVKDGETGYLTPPLDSTAIAQAVVKFFKENKAEEFARNIRVFREVFSWDRMIETVEDLAGEEGRVRC